MEYDLYELKGDGQTCPGLPPVKRRILCWDRMFLLPGFERAEYSPALQDVARIESHEFDELKRRVCDATRRYRVASWQMFLSSVLVIGVLIALPVAVLRKSRFGAALPFAAVVLSFSTFFIQYGRVTANNRVVDEDIDLILGDLNKRKCGPVAALKRSNVGTCKHKHQRCERKIVFGPEAERVVANRSAIPSYMPGLVPNSGQPDADPRALPYPQTVSTV